MKKIFLLLISLVLAVSMTACGRGSKNDSEEVLNIYALNKGYGLNWLKKLSEAFTEKYGYQVDYDSTVSVTTLAGEISYDYTPYDLIFTGSTHMNFINTDRGSRGSKLYLEELSEVYNSVPDSEQKKVSEKLEENILSSFKFENSDGGVSYYAVPWVGSVSALLYHKDAVREVMGESYEMPRTTDELLNLCAELKAKGKTPFILCADTPYYHFMYETWWAQYEGLDGIEDFFYGKYSDFQGSIVRGPGIFLQDGRYEALRELQRFVGKSQGYVYSDSDGLDWMTTQSYFMDNRSVLLANGDWNNMEMSASFPENDVMMMRVPVISSIKDKLSDGGMSDDTLSLIIKEIDEGASSSQICSQEDFLKIRAARRIAYSYACDFTSCIPYNCNAKSIAKKFLVFMASDEGQEIFAHAQNGLTNAFNGYKVSEDTAYYDSLSPFVKSVTEISENHTAYHTLYRSDLVSKGNLVNFGTASTDSTPIEIKIYKNENAVQFLDDIFEYYTKNNNFNWKLLLEAAGWKA